MFRPLGSIMNMINEAGYEVTYAYDDLLFIGHSDFLIQFSASDEKKVKLFFHHELKEALRGLIKENFRNVLKESDITIEYSGTFILKERPESEEIDIVYYT